MCCSTSSSAACDSSWPHQTASTSMCAAAAVPPLAVPLRGRLAVPLVWAAAADADVLLLAPSADLDVAHLLQHLLRHLHAAALLAVRRGAQRRRRQQRRWRRLWSSSAGCCCVLRCSLQVSDDVVSRAERPSHSSRQWVGRPPPPRSFALLERHAPGLDAGSTSRDFAERDEEQHARAEPLWPQLSACCRCRQAQSMR